MPIYDYQCQSCHVITEKIRPVAVTTIVCPECILDTKLGGPRVPGVAVRLLSAPARITMADMPTLNRKRQRIKEPVWRYPDGHVESVH